MPTKQKKYPEAYLLDTNVLLEILLEQEDFASCVNLLKKIEQGHLRAWVLDFSIYSICLVAARKKVSPAKVTYFLELINAIPNLCILRCPSFWMAEATTQMSKLTLDFDDALHYTVAKTNHLTLVTFDKHLKKSGIITKTPNF